MAERPDQQFVYFSTQQWFRQFGGLGGPGGAAGTLKIREIKRNMKINAKLKKQLLRHSNDAEYS